MHQLIFKVILPIVVIVLVPPLPSGAEFAVQAGISKLVGEWRSITVVPPGEAPAVASSVVVSAAKDIVTLRLDTAPMPLEAAVFAVSRTESLLLARGEGGGGATQLIIIRPIGEGQVRLEVYMEYPKARAASNFYYAEVFKKVS